MFAGGCSNGDLTVSQYATEVAALVQEFDARLDAEAEAYFSTPPSVDSLRKYLDIRVDGYRKAVDDLDAALEGKDPVDIIKKAQKVIDIWTSEETVGTLRSMAELVLG